MTTLLPFGIIVPLDKGASVPLPKEEVTVLHGLQPQDFATLDEIWEAHDAKEVMACDLETKGLKPHLPDTWIATIGFADSRGAISIDLRDSHPDLLLYILRGLARCKVPLIGYNFMFDMCFLARYMQEAGLSHRSLNWVADAYIGYRQFSNEGWLGQRHGLKDAQLQLLQWESKGNTELDQWLIDNGHYTLCKEGEARVPTPRRDCMHLAPTEVLCYYNALDCQSTLDIWEKVLRPLFKSFQAKQEKRGTPTSKDLHKWMIEEGKCLIDNYYSGIDVDYEALLKFQSDNETLMLQARTQFLTQVQEAVASYNEDELQKLLAAEPKETVAPKYKKEPKHYKKDGSVTTVWLKWREEQDKNPQPRETVNHGKWRKKVEELKADIACFFEKPPQSDIGKELLFNMDSTQQMSQLMYGVLDYPVKVRTESGAPAMNSDAFKGFGTHGELLQEYATFSTYATMVESYLRELVQDKDGTYRLHPKFKLPGTHTLRLSGDGGINLQNPAKVRQFLDCLKELRDDWMLMDFDMCYSADTEVLTKRGWISFEFVTTEDYVWQVDKDTLKGEWVNPLRVIWKDYHGPMYSVGNLRGSLLVTQGHTMLYLGQQSCERKAGRRVVCPVENGIKEGWELPVCSTGAQATGETSDYEIQMALMLQADGSLYNLDKKNQQYRIEVSKPRKREKVRELLGRGGKVSPPRGKQTMETELWLAISFASKLLDGTKDKLLDLSSLGSEHLAVFLDALAMWDGTYSHDGSIVYSCTKHHNLHEVQAYVTRCGMECKVNEERHRCTIYTNRSFRLRKVDFLRGTYEGKVGCVTVPSGFIQVRRKGQAFVCGNCAIEPHLLCHASQDEGLMKLYGPNAVPNDVYLFFGSQVKGIGEPFLACGYDPFNPKKEAIAECKKLHKGLRNICKVAFLALNYGAGWRRIQAQLLLDGISLSDEDAQALYKGYHNVFKGVLPYGERLKAEWERNGGWAFNAIGQPICCAEDYLHDIINRCISGDTLVRVKDKGWVKACEVACGELVWDGSEWRKTDGWVVNGVKPTINFVDVAMTCDHKVLTINGMEECGNVRDGEVCGARLPTYSWSDVWELARGIWRSLVG